MSIVLKNNASDFLAAAIDSSQTSITLESGASFPVLGAGEYFYGTIESTEGVLEIVKVNARVGNTLTVVRAQDGTSAASFAQGSRFELRVNVASIEGGPFTPADANAVQRTIQEKLQDSVSVKDFGAVGDGVTDDTSAFLAAFELGGHIVVPSGMTCLVNKMTVTTSNLHLDIAQDSSIVLSNASFSGSGLVFSGQNVKISGGTITAQTGGYFAEYLLLTQGARFLLENCKVGYPIKPVFVSPDGVNIPYGTASVRCNGQYSRVAGCELFNCPGAALQLAGNNASLLDSTLRDCVTGLMIRDNNDTLVQGNHLIDNNAGGTLSGANGILSFNQSGTIDEPTGVRGISIVNNVISGNGEHGTYLQSDDTVITGNVVHSNLASGIKANGRNMVITDNICYDNLFGDTDNAEIYLQSKFGRTIVSNNRCTNKDPSARAGMRIAAWIEARDAVDESFDMVVTGNFVGTYTTSVSLYAKANLVFSNNVCMSRIVLQRNIGTEPNPTACIVSNNRLPGLNNNIECRAGIVDGNIIGGVSGLFGAIVSNNMFTNQTSSILITGPIKFIGNTFNYDTTSRLFTQAANQPTNNNLEFTKNNFNSVSGQNVLEYTSSGVSGNRNVFEGNRISGAALFNGWGDNHLFLGNVRTDGGNLATIRGDDCIAKNNIGSFSNLGTGNIVSDNK